MHRPLHNSETIITASGLTYVDLVVGKGPTPKQGDTVVVNYTGQFINGKIFDSSVGHRPFEFTVGRGQVIICLSGCFSTLPYVGVRLE